LLGANAADVPQGILQHALLDRDLGARIEMLQAAAAAVAEVRAERRHPLGTRLEHLDERGDFVRGFLVVRRAGDCFTRQRAFDKNSLAIAARNAAEFMARNAESG